MKLQEASNGVFTINRLCENQLGQIAIVKAHLFYSSHRLEEAELGFRLGKQKCLKSFFDRYSTDHKTFVWLTTGNNPRCASKSHVSFSSKLVW